MTRFWSIISSALLLLCAPLHADTTNVALARATVIENNVAYFRISQVTNGLAAELQSAQTALAATNKLAGTVLDLRFANGNDEASAKSTAELFAARKMPLAILVNSETRGAAAALALELRTARDGLVLGGATAGLKPDVSVEVSNADEREFLKNPFAALARNATSAVVTTNSNFAPFIDHTSEADLVREKVKDGDQDEDADPTRPAEPQKPYIHDPVLARAVDLIKALAVVRASRS